MAATMSGLVYVRVVNQHNESLADVATPGISLPSGSRLHARRMAIPHFAYDYRIIAEEQGPYPIGFAVNIEGTTYSDFHTVPIMASESYWYYDFVITV